MSAYEGDHDDALRKRSGSVNDDSPLVAFLYTLLRGVAPVGTIEAAVRDALLGELTGKTYAYTNGYLAKYAQDIATRLTTGNPFPDPSADTPADPNDAE